MKIGLQPLFPRPREGFRRGAQIVCQGVNAPLYVEQIELVFILEVVVDNALGDSAAPSGRWAAFFSICITTANSVPAG